MVRVDRRGPRPATWPTLSSTDPTVSCSQEKPPRGKLLYIFASGIGSYILVEKMRIIHMSVVTVQIRILQATNHHHTAETTPAVCVKNMAKFCMSCMWSYWTEKSE